METGRETKLGRELLLKPLHISDSDGATGIARACAIFFRFSCNFWEAKQRGLKRRDTEMLILIGVLFFQLNVTPKRRRLVARDYK